MVVGRFLSWYVVTGYFRGAKIVQVYRKRKIKIMYRTRKYSIIYVYM